MKNTQVLLASRPRVMVQKSNFSFQTVSIPDLREGQVLVRNEYISLDPAIRGWMNAGTTYMPGIPLGDVVRAFAAGEVIDSRHPDYAKGTFVEGLLGAQQYAVSNGKGLKKLDISKGPLPWHLGVLGMPGMTAYFGLLERGKPQTGDTIFISGAAGIVGSTVGQIAKIKGCRVVGTAGSDEKCQYLLDDCGFDAAFNYKTESTDAALKKHCPDGLHIYYDNVGGEMLDAALANLARGARVVICGAISQYNATSMYGPKNYMKIVTARGTMTGIIVFDFADRYAEAVAQLSAWLNSGQMRTKQQIEHGIENFPAALLKLYTGDNFGKLLLKLNS